MTPDDYIGRCIGLVIALSDGLDSDEVGWAMHLIEHGEPAEGLASLARSPDGSPQGLVREAALQISSLIGDLVPDDSLPDEIQALRRNQ